MTDWPTVIISASISLVGGGLAGTVVSQLFVKRTVKITSHSQSREKATEAFSDWTAETYMLYMGNEAKWVGGVRNQLATATMNSPDYLRLKEKADVAIKTNFPPESHADFVRFGQWLEKTLFEAFNKGTLFPFDEFRNQRDEFIHKLRTHK